MALSVVTNTSAITSQRYLARNQRALDRSLARLSSGLRIVRASDDAAGLAISESLRAQTRSLAMARRNAHDGISMAQTAEGALNETHTMLMRMRELSIQAANGTMDTTQRGMINDEFVALREEIERIADVTEFNGMALLDTAGSVDLQVGIYAASENQITVTMESAHTVDLAAGLETASVGTAAGALASLDLLDTAITNVAEIRGNFGVIQNRLEVTIDRLHSAEENLTAAESRIRDADIAQETTSMTRGQILLQAGVAMLAQANQIPAVAMALIAG